MWARFLSTLARHPGPPPGTCAYDFVSGHLGARDVRHRARCRGCSQRLSSGRVWTGGFAVFTAGAVDRKSMATKRGRMGLNR